jgi:hypothetical protein
LDSASSSPADETPATSIALKVKVVAPAMDQPPCV